MRSLISQMRATSVAIRIATESSPLGRVSMDLRNSWRMYWESSSTELPEDRLGSSGWEAQPDGKVLIEEVIDAAFMGIPNRNSRDVSK